MGATRSELSANASHMQKVEHLRGVYVLRCLVLRRLSFFRDVFIASNVIFVDFTHWRFALLNVYACICPLGIYDYICLLGIHACICVLTVYSLYTYICLFDAY